MGQDYMKISEVFALILGSLDQDQIKGITDTHNQALRQVANSQDIFAQLELQKKFFSHIQQAVATLVPADLQRIQTVMTRTF